MFTLGGTNQSSEKWVKATIDWIARAQPVLRRSDIYSCYSKHVCVCVDEVWHSDYQGIPSDSKLRYVVRVSCKIQTGSIESIGALNVAHTFN